MLTTVSSRSKNLVIILITSHRVSPSYRPRIALEMRRWSSAVLRLNARPPPRYKHHDQTKRTRPSVEQQSTIRLVSDRLRPRWEKNRFRSTRTRSRTYVHRTRVLAYLGSAERPQAAGKSPRRRWVFLLIFFGGKAIDIKRQSIIGKLPSLSTTGPLASICPPMVNPPAKNFYSPCGTERRLRRRTHSTVCSFHRRALWRRYEPGAAQTVVRPRRLIARFS